MKRIMKRRLILVLLVFVLFLMHGRNQTTSGDGALLEFINSFFFSNLPNSRAMGASGVHPSAAKSRVLIDEGLTASGIAGRLLFIPATGPDGYHQGSPEDEPCRGFDERQFRHVLTRNMAVMETEVTRQMWADLKHQQPTLPDDPTYLLRGAGATNPIQHATWYEVVLFANLLSIQGGLPQCYFTTQSKTHPIDANNYQDGAYYCDFSALGYRLPAEGEWEYVARAGTMTPFWAKEDGYNPLSCSSCAGRLPALRTAAIFCNSDSGGTRPAGTTSPNPWNIKDVSGNVEEWCWDWYRAEYPKGAVTDYHGPSNGIYRVTRGGSWLWSARACRSASRMSARPSNRGSGSIGFRLVRTLPYSK